MLCLYCRLCVWVCLSVFVCVCVCLFVWIRKTKTEKRSFNFSLVNDLSTVGATRGHLKPLLNTIIMECMITGQSTSIQYPNIILQTDRTLWIRITRFEDDRLHRQNLYIFYIVKTTNNATVIIHTTTVSWKDVPSHWWWWVISSRKAFRCTRLHRKSAREHCLLLVFCLTE